jgi:outer membrane protein
MKLRSLIGICLLALSASVATAADGATVIGLITDGPMARPLIPAAGLEAEIAKLTAGEFDVRIPAEKRLEGDWTLQGIEQIFERQLADPDVDIIMCLGVIACHIAGNRPILVKPVILAIVADPALQGFPFADGASGRKNLVYVTNLHSIDDDLRIYKQAVDFDRLGIVIDNAILKAFGDFLQEKIASLEKELAVEIISIPLSDSVQGAVDAVPADIDSVYITPLRLDDAGMRDLADALIARRLKSFSLSGVTDLNFGLLMSYGGRPEDIVRVTRRLALNVQRILLGDAPEKIPVFLQESRRLAINMRTAKAIGYSPRYAILADAEQLFLEGLEEGEELGLLDAMNEAIDANLNLQIVAYDPQLAEEEAMISRSELLPQFQLGAGWEKTDTGAVVQFGPEQSTDVDLGARQLIYSDDAWAGFRISQYLKNSSDEDYRAAMLDILKISGQNYLNLLRTIALEDVQRANLEVTRTNLELARIRESIGFSGRADVLRWETQISRDRRNLIDAEASRRQAEDRMNQILNRSQKTRIKPSDASVDRSLNFFTQPQFLALIDNAETWQTFQDFVVKQGYEQAPEIRSAEYIVSAGERQVTASRRRGWLPEFGASAFGNRNIDRTFQNPGGIQSQFIDDSSWGLGVEATLPIFSGGALRADVNRSQLSLRQAERRRAAIAQEVETLTRIALEQVGSSFSAIELTASAARTSGENLAIVTELYSQGAVSVVDLIDAQNAALGSELSAAQAIYIYLGDVMEVLRVTGDFSLMLEPQYAAEWFQQVDDYFQGQGVTLPK